MKLISLLLSALILHLLAIQAFAVTVYDHAQTGSCISVTRTIDVPAQATIYARISTYSAAKKTNTLPDGSSQTIQPEGFATGSTIVVVPGINGPVMSINKSGTGTTSERVLNVNAPHGIVQVIHIGMCSGGGISVADFTTQVTW